METFEQRFRASDNFILRTIAGESVLVAVGPVADPRLENAMISLNETGTFLWNLFTEGPMTEKQAVSAAEAEFEAPDGIIPLHVHEFIKALYQVGLLIKEE